jgi:hypothetical protein
MASRSENAISCKIGTEQQRHTGTKVLQSAINLCAFRAFVTSKARPTWTNFKKQSQFAGVNVKSFRTKDCEEICG